MIIQEIKIQNEGYVDCKSAFYTAKDILQSDKNYVFSNGKNLMTGEIDSGIWAVSYLLSMYKHRPKDFVLYEKTNVSVNGKTIALDEVAEYSCYMDSIYPLFSSRKTVRNIVAQGLKKNKSERTAEEIRELFELDSERFERPLTGAGNERFRAMAAIGYSHNKQIFCFPWLSKMRFDGYHDNLTWLLDKLETLNMIAIVPIGLG